MHDGATPSPWSDQLAALQEIGDGTDRGPVIHSRMPGREVLHEHRRAPRRVRPARGDEELGQFVGDAMGAVVRRVTPLGKPKRAVDRGARKQLVAGLPTHAVSATELGHRVEPALMIGHELQPLVHRGHLLPEHRSPRERAAPTVECHPSCRNTLLPINPVCTRLRSNVALKLPSNRAAHSTPDSSPAQKHHRTSLALAA